MLLLISCVIGLFILTSILVSAFGWQRKRRRRRIQRYRAVHGVSSLAEKRQREQESSVDCTGEDIKYLIRQCHNLVLDQESKEKLDQLYIAKENLEMRTKIGQGAFGDVWEAMYSSQEPGKGPKKGPRKVAMKTLKNICNSEDVCHVIQEALMMVEFQHPNVLGLIGISVNGTGSSACPMLVLPFMENGDMHKFLRSFRYGDVPMSQ
ncbi:hypothetical protein CAPTEDRAFT_211857, partial [Capitella teleta]